MNIKEIKELVDIVARRGLAGLEVERAGFRLRIEGPRPELVPHPRISGRPQLEAPAADSSPSVDALPAADLAPARTASRETLVDEGLHVVTSPIVGTFYRSPNPDAEPFVKVGDNVEKGGTLCIVEAMKLMNEIEADVPGTIVEVFPQNGQPVEFGERLFTIKLR